MMMISLKTPFANTSNWRYEHVIGALIVPLLLASCLSAPSVAQQLPNARSVPASSIKGSSQLQPENYLLGAGDTIRIDVFRVTEYSGEYEVLINGILNLPMVGQVQVSGLTIEQASAAISQAYGRRLRRPIVTVSLVSPRPLRIGVAGEVSHPGEYVLQREGTQFPSLVGVLEAAGGITQSAELRQLIISRTAENGTRQTIVADLWSFLETGDLSYNVALQDGDTVFIPTRTTFDSSESLHLAAASFAADESRPLNVAVVGEVGRPGPYTVSGKSKTDENGSLDNNRSILPTVTSAIQIAGGIKSQANIRDVKVYRRNRNGAEQTIEVNLWNLLSEGKISEDIALQEGDTIYVPQAADLSPEEISETASASFAPDTISINVVGEVDRPGTIEVSPNTPLSQGILAAGGFNNRASTGVVELVRLNANGTASRDELPVDFAEGIDDEMNPLLRNNDTIIVRRSASASFGDTLDNVVGPLGKVFSLFTLPASIFRLF